MSVCGYDMIESTHNNGMNADWGIPRGFAALHTPAGYAHRYLQKND